MRVLLIDVNCKYSSTGKIVYDLYERLQSDGHEAAVCYGRGPKVEGKNIYKFGIDLETKIHGLLARITGLNGYFSPFSTKRLIKYIDEFNPDVVHIHELHAYFVNIKPLINYLKRKKTKVVWTFHCEYMYTGKCGGTYDCNEFQSNCGNCPKLKAYPKSWFFDFTKKMLRDKKMLLSDWDFRIVTPSNYLADRVKLSFLKDKKTDVIHNGIDTENIFYPRNADDIISLKKKYGIKDKKIVLSVAPHIMSDSKGGKRVIDIAGQFNDDSIHFVLIGADDNFKIGNNITVLKKTSNQDDLALWYSAADVFLICSQWENFPTTCLEALCCGTPIVGIDAGGTKETAPSPYGIFCSDNNAELIKNIKNQLNAEFVSDEISQLGEKLYSKSNMYKNYMSLY